MPRARLYNTYDKTLLYLMLAFLAAHLVNHLALVFGQATHIQLMDQLRVLYRFPILEALLIWVIARQVWAGIKQMRRFGPLKSKGRYRVLVWSSLNLIFFLIIYLSAVAGGRWVLGLDTNIFFGGAGINVWPYALIFHTYYFLAAFCVLAHLGTVIWLRQRAAAPIFADQFYKGSLALGLIVAVLINLSLSGVLSDIVIPEAYLAQ